MQHRGGALHYDVLMGLAAAWRRQGAWAAAVTFLVPGVLALAVFTMLLGGGFRGFGALGQVFTGPQVPEARLTTATVPARPHASRLPVVPELQPLDERFVTAPPATAPGDRGRGTSAPAAPVATVPPRRPSAGSPATAPAPSSPAPQRPAAQPSSPVRQAGGQVADGVGAVPVVGPAGHDVVTTVVDVIAPPPPVQLPSVK
jgi:hypothetical protein